MKGMDVVTTLQGIENVTFEMKIENLTTNITLLFSNIKITYNNVL